MHEQRDVSGGERQLAIVGHRIDLMQLVRSALAGVFSEGDRWES